MPTKTKKSAPKKKPAKKKPAKKKPAPKPMGRPTKYKPEYCQAIIDYFTVEPLDADKNPVAPPYIQEFCLSIGISKECMHDWVAKYPDFSDAYSVAKSKQKQLMITNALLGRYNPSFAWRAMANMHNWRDQQDINQNITLPPGLKISFDG